MTFDQLSEDEKIKLGALLVKHSADIQAAVLAAYEEGVMTGAMRVARNLALGKPAAPSTGDDGDDDQDTDSPLSNADKSALMRLGIDPAKSFYVRNSRFTITGYKPSRWKYPISVQTQKGARYKMTVEQVKRSQGN